MLLKWMCQATLSIIKTYHLETDLYGLLKFFFVSTQLSRVSIFSLHSQHTDYLKH